MPGGLKLGIAMHLVYQFTSKSESDRNFNVSGQRLAKLRQNLSDTSLV